MKTTREQRGLISESYLLHKTDEAVVVQWSSGIYHHPKRLRIVTGGGYKMHGFNIMARDVWIPALNPQIMRPCRTCWG